MAIYQDIAYTAVAVGPLDLAGGVNFLRHNSATPFPWVSANLFDTVQKPLFTRWISKKIQGVNVVITAITAPSPQLEAGVTIKPWDLILDELINDINRTNNNPFIILLSSLPDADNQRIAERFPALHLLIGADRHKGNISPRQVNETLLTQTGAQGKYQGLLNLKFGSQRQWGKDHAKVLAELQNKLGSLNWQLKRLEKKAALPESGNKYQGSITRIHKEQEELNTKIDATRNILEQENSVASSKNQYTARFVALKKNMPTDPTTEEKLQQLKHTIRELHKKKMAAAEKNAAEKNAPLWNTLLGNTGCTTCHQSQADFWESTSHAKAYATLVQKDKNLDLQCLPCHLTLDIQKSPLNQLPPRDHLLSYPVTLHNVGCESCHGAGKQHSKEPERFQMTRLPGKEICLICHTNEHDENFDYSTKLAQISCPVE